MLELMRTNQRIKGIFNSNINKRVTAETEKLQKVVAEKDDEIAKLMDVSGNCRLPTRGRMICRRRSMLQRARRKKRCVLRLSRQRRRRRSSLVCWD